MSDVAEQTASCRSDGRYLVVGRHTRYQSYLRLVLLGLRLVFFPLPRLLDLDSELVLALRLRLDLESASESASDDDELESESESELPSSLSLSLLESESEPESESDEDRLEELNRQEEVSNDKASRSER